MCIYSVIYRSICDLKTYKYIISSKYFFLILVHITAWNGYGLVSPCRRIIRMIEDSFISSLIVSFTLICCFFNLVLQNRKIIEKHLLNYNLLYKI